MGYPFFIFKNKSSLDYNIIVNKLPPIHFVENQVEYLDIPGRDGYLTMDMQKRESIEKPVEITIYPDDLLQSIRKWLKGDGRITFSNDEDVFYKARVNSIKEFIGATNEKVASITFKCQPYGYLHSGQNIITINTKGTTLFNNEEDSEPYFKIYGSGTVNLFINNDKIILNIDEYVEIDSELMESWKGTLNKPFIGKFPTFASGENIISWTGNISKIEVIPRWRR